MLAPRGRLFSYVGSPKWTEETHDSSTDQQAYDQLLGIAPSLSRPQRTDADADEYKRCLARTEKRRMEILDIWVCAQQQPSRHDDQAAGADDRPAVPHSGCAPSHKHD